MSGWGYAIGAVTDAISGHQANQASVAQANANRTFARNAHQIEVEDLRKAGLNPMLSFRGSGAQISGGAMPTVRPITENTGGKVASALMLSKQMALTDAETSLATNSAAKAASEKANIDTDTKLKRVHMIGGLASAEQARTAADLNAQEVEESKARIPRIAMEIKAMKSTINLQNFEAELKQAETTGAKIDAQIKDKNWNAIISLMESQAQLAKYHLAGAELESTAAQAAWRIKLAEWGLTTRQVAELGNMVPGFSFLLNPTFNKTVTKEVTTK